MPDKPMFVYVTYIESTAESAGWPAVLANLKSLLETGHVLPQALGP
jgi:hypothetical protein